MFDLCKGGHSCLLLRFVSFEGDNAFELNWYNVYLIAINKDEDEHQNVDCTSIYSDARESLSDGVPEEFFDLSPLKFLDLRLAYRRSETCHIHLPPSSFPISLSHLIF